MAYDLELTPRAQRAGLSAQRHIDTPTVNPNARPVGQNVGITANPNATPGAGRGSRNGDSRWGMGGQPSITPRLDSNPRRNTADAVAASNRSGAFGTGAQNLQQRRDLFGKMSKDTGNVDAYKGQAAALGVTPGGWEAAVRRLNMGSPATPAVAATPAPATAGPSPLAGAMGAITPPPMGMAPLAPRPTWQQAAGLPGAAPPTPAPTPAPTPQQQIAENSPQPEVAPTTQAAPSAPQPEIPPATQASQAAAPALDFTVPNAGRDAEGNIHAIGDGSTKDGKPVSDGSRNVGIFNQIGNWANAVKTGAQRAAGGIFNKAGQAHIASSRLLGEADKAAKLAQIADVAKNTSKTGTAARATYKAATAAQEAVAASKMGTAASLTRTGNALEKVGSGVSKVGRAASLGKYGAAAGKAAPWAQAAQIIYETGALMGSEDRRERRKNELEAAVSNKSAARASARGAWEGVVNPAATIYATGAHAADAWDSSARAKRSQESARAALPRHEKVKAFRAQMGDRLNSMSPKERIAAMKEYGL